MHLYKIQIKPIMNFASPLHSDTFFGAFCWNYKYIYGEDKLIDLLEACKQQQPPIIFSNAFMHDYLPLPMGIKDLSRDMKNVTDKEVRKSVYQENKGLKKCNLISLEGFISIREGNSNGFSKFLGKMEVVEYEEAHNMISRDLGIVTSTEEGGNLYSVLSSFSQNKDFDVYALTTLDESVILPVLNRMFMEGIGAKKSIGKGAFSVEKIQIVDELLKCNNANAFVALSNFIPRQDDPIEGHYKTFVKYGKLDREYASSETPYKKPLLFIQSGATFFTSQTIKPYYGRCISNVAVQKDVVVNACTIALPILNL